MKIKNIGLVLLLSLGATQIFALNLEEARAQKKVCELPDGTLQAKSTESEVVSLVSEVNSKREEAYNQISKNENAALTTVKNRAGAKLIAEYGDCNNN
ncbi:MAG: DUF1318 domain-containing protein [Gammaproteobacteria bacterium]|nr:DUF1318 domain-containing protein [Gammaproteobacteria bacterium]